ncbi:MAG: hypothetical protein AABX89_07880 [Candidatus Thermoplasmatota archaeon]
MKTRLPSLLLAFAFIGLALATVPASSADNLLDPVYDAVADNSDGLVTRGDCETGGSGLQIGGDEANCAQELVVDLDSERCDDFDGSGVGSGVEVTFNDGQETPNGLCQRYPNSMDFLPVFDFTPDLSPTVGPLAEFFQYNPAGNVVVTVTLFESDGTTARNWVDRQSTELRFNGLSSAGDGTVYENFCGNLLDPIPADCAAFVVEADNVAGNVATFTVSRALLENAENNALPINGWAIMVQDLSTETGLLSPDVLGHDFSFYNPLAQALIGAGLFEAADIADTVPVPVFVIPNVPALVITPTSLGLTEAAAGRTATYTVALQSLPRSTVTIDITAVSGGTAGTSADYTFTGPASPATTVLNAVPPAPAAGAVRLTFTPQNYATPQTITVTAVDDPVAEPGAPEAFSLRHLSGSSDSRYAGLSKFLAGTITDDDAKGMTVTCGATPLAEATPSTTIDCTVTLQRGGSKPVFITIDAASLAGRAEVSGTNLAFYTAGSSGTKVIKLKAINDNLFTQNEALTVRIVGQSEDPDYNFVNPTTCQATTPTATPCTATTTVTVLDNELPAITVTPTTLAVTEVAGADHAKSYTLAFTGGTPHAGQSVTITPSAENGQVTLSGPVTLSSILTSAPITVTAADDRVVDVTAAASDIVSHALVFAGGASGLHLGGTVGTVAATITDDDVAAITVSGLTPTVINEFGNPTSGTFTVSIGANVDPNAGKVVKVNLAHAGGQVTLSSASVTLSGNGDAATRTATVTVTSINDNFIEANALAALVSTTVDAAGTTDDAFDGLNPDDVTALVNSEDMAGFVIAPETPLALLEAGATSGTYTVKLTAQPAADKVVAVQITAAGGQVTIDADSLTDGIQDTVQFTGTTWNTGRIITVRAVDDVADEDNAVVPVTLNHAVVAVAESDADFAAITGTKEVTVLDNDEPEIRITGATTPTARRNIDECDPEDGGTCPSTTYTVSVVTPLTADTGTVVVDLTADPAFVAALLPDPQVDGFTISPATITFSSTHTSQVITVTYPNDVRVGNLDGVIHHLVNVATSTDARFIADAPLIDDFFLKGITNDEPSVAVTGGPLALTEALAGRAGTLTVKLGTNLAPLTNVVVDVASSAPADFTVSPAQLVFNSANDKSGLTVTVTAIDDAVVEMALETGFQATFTVDSVGTTALGYAAETIDPVAISVLDNDAANLLLAHTGAGTTLAEPAGTDTVEVSLSAPIDTAVFVTVTPSSGFTVNDLNGDDAGQMTFAANAVGPVTLTLTPLADAVDQGASRSLTLAAASSLGLGLTRAITDPTALPVTLTDDDVAGVTLSKLTASVKEALAASSRTDTYTVVLTSEPTSNVVVAIDDAAGNEIAAIASLTFTAVNWFEPQTVTVAANDDRVDDGAPNQVASLVNNPDSEETFYSALPNQAVAVTILDDDIAALVLSETTRTIEEGSSDGASNQFTVRLDSEPTGDITVALSVVETGDAGTTVTTAPLSLTFTAGDLGNWNTPQTVTLAATDDDGFQTELATVTLDPSGDSVYDLLPSRTVGVTVTDTDVGILINGETASNTPITVNEGASGSYTVELTADTTFFVAVSISAGDSNENGEGCFVEMKSAQALDASDQAFSCGPIDLVFGPTGSGVPTGTTALTVDLQAVNDEEVDMDNLVSGAPRIIVLTHEASSADPSFQGAETRTVTVSNADDDPCSANDATAAVCAVRDGGVGDGFVAGFGIPIVGQMPALVLTEEGVEVTATAQEFDLIDGWTAYTDALTLYVQRDCGGLAALVDFVDEELCQVGETVVASDTQSPVAGVYTFSFTYEELEDAFPGVPVSALHLFVETREATSRYSNYFLPKEAAYEAGALLEDFTAADALDDLSFTPVVLVDSQLGGALPSDDFIAKFGLPETVGFVADGENAIVNVVVYDGAGATVTSGTYNLVLQVDCGALKPVANAAGVECAGGADTTTLTKVYSFTVDDVAPEDGVDVLIPAADLEFLLNGQPATGLHLFVEDGLRASNYAVPTAVLLEAGLYALADLIDGSLFTPVPLIDEGAIPAGDGFLAYFAMGAAPALAFVANDDSLVEVSIIDPATGTPIPASSATLVLQVDCGPLKPVADVIAVECAGGADTTTLTKSYAFTTPATGPALVGIPQADLEFLLNGQPATVLHVFAERNLDGVYQQSSYVLRTPIDNAVTAQTLDLVDGSTFTPVLLIAEPDTSLVTDLAACLMGEPADPTTCLPEDVGAAVAMVQEEAEAIVEMVEGLPAMLTELLCEEDSPLVTVCEAIPDDPVGFVEETVETVQELVPERLGELLPDCTGLETAPVYVCDAEDGVLGQGVRVKAGPLTLTL